MKLVSLCAALLSFAASAQAGCTLTGTYVSGTDVSTCSSIVINNLTVPAGVTLDLTKLKTGATITFQGTSKFGTKLWSGPLVLVTGTNLKVGGTGVLDGQGKWYWDQFKKNSGITRPAFFRAQNCVGSTFSGLTIKNSPTGHVSIKGCSKTTFTGLTLDSSAGKGLAKNTDGFGFGRNDHVTVQNSKVYNQDDCLAVGSGTNNVFQNNYCNGGHGISIGSLGGAAVDSSDTVNGLTVYNNHIVDNTEGLRIKTIENLVGLVTNVNYTNNVLTNCKNAITIRSDYTKSTGGYTGNPNSKVTISGITINGLSGTATNKYSILVNKNVASNWKFSGITVTAKSTGTCKNQPTNIKCT